MKVKVVVSCKNQVKYLCKKIQKGGVANSVSLYFTYFEGLSRYRITRRVRVCLKAFVAAAFGSSEPFYSGKWACPVGAIPT